MSAITAHGGQRRRSYGPRSRTGARFAGVWRFARHFLEMCIAMCIGFGIGDAAYFGVTGLLGYSAPFRELPVLSLFVVTFNLTAPMAAWMRFRRMPTRAIAEMSASMALVAMGLLCLGWLGVVRMSATPLLEHSLMMPAMLVPMLWRRELYAGHAGQLDRSGEATP